MRYRQVWIAYALLTSLAAACRADIFRWDNGALIPGTEGITPGPGVQLSHRDLTFAELSSINLTGADFLSSKLTNANLSGANISGAFFAFAELTNADLTGAKVNGAHFGNYLDPSLGLTKEQLYSTASYQAKNLQGIDLQNRDLTSWDFSGQDMTDAVLYIATLANADLAGATVARANFEGTVFKGFTKEQLYATASYQSKDLRGIRLSGIWGDNDLSGWDLSGQDLSGASFTMATLTNAVLTGANVSGADFGGITSRGFTKEQLYSTASYQAKDLRGIKLNGFADPYFSSPSSLAGWDLRGQDLAGADLSLTTLTNTNLADAVVAGVNFSHATKQGLTKEQLYSTASYQAKDLQGIAFTGDYCCSHDDLTGWDFSGQNLTGADFSSATLTETNLAGANLINSRFSPKHDDQGDIALLTNANLTAADTRGAQGLNLTKAFSRNAILPDGTISGFNLTTGERLLVRDDDGLASLPQARPPSRPPIPVKIQNYLNMADGSILQLLLDADPWDSLISFEAGIPVQLGGALELTFADDVELASQLGRTLRIFDWTGVSPSGQFQIQSQYVWDVANLYTKGEVTLVAVPEPTAVSIKLACTLAFVARLRVTRLRVRR